MKTTQSPESIMDEFAERTGLDPAAGREPTRYLWTDAFAVCNFLELFRRGGDRRHLQRALDLVDQVHRVLGRHRDDDPREGWISGLGETEGRRHPTRGGLRIGKRLPERRPGEPFDESSEWDRDGQYFHYLTKWMHALERVARASGEAAYLRWALELAEASHSAFVYPVGESETKRMAWKMSIDLSRPLVPSMGHHDPLDGLISCQQIQAAGTDLGLPPGECDLAGQIADFAAMGEGVCWRTSDALGIGGLLTDACRLAQLIGASGLPESARLEFLLEEAKHSLEALERMNIMGGSAERRLAFRELGLCIGLHAIERTRATLDQRPERFPNREAIAEQLSRCGRFLAWVDAIEMFWLEPNNQSSRGWRAHQDINCVMLATSLGPDGFLCPAATGPR